MPTTDRPPVIINPGIVTSTASSSSSSRAYSNNEGAGGSSNASATSGSGETSNSSDESFVSGANSSRASSHAIATDESANTSATVEIPSYTNDYTDTDSYNNSAELIRLAEGGTITVDVVTHKNIADNRSYTISIIQNPGNGSLTIDVNGNITYAPDSGFLGIDEFIYQIRDDSGETTIGMIKLSVTEAAPVIWRNPQTLDIVYWAMGTGVPIAGQFLEDRPGLDWYIAGVGDFDFDGKTDDILWGYSSGLFQTAVWIMEDQALVSSAYDYAATTSFQDPTWEIQAIGSFDGDRQVNDLVYRNLITGENAIVTVTGANLDDIETNEFSLQTVTDLTWRIGGVGELDGDGEFNDIVWHNAVNGEVAIWSIASDELEAANYIMHNGNRVLVEGDWVLSGVSDLDSDGIADDLLWHNTSIGQTAYWHMENNIIESTSTLDVDFTGKGWNAITAPVGQGDILS